jgi:lipopolysaccharide transport system permease protein
MNDIASRSIHTPDGPQGCSAPTSPSSLSETRDIETIIVPRSGWTALNYQELLEYRELLWFLVWRDVSTRYRQTLLGGSWAVIQPLLSMAIFTLIFNRIAKFPSEGFPYTVFVFAGLIPWTFFSQGFSQAALSMVSQHQLLTKVYFPRIYVPLAASMVCLIDLLISLGLYALILLFFGIAPSWTIVLLPFLILLTLITTISAGVMIAALTVFYRDFRQIVPFLVQILLYLTFVVYPGTQIARPLYRWILSLNPMFGIVMAFRSAILGLSWDLPCLAISTVTAVAAFIFAMLYFRRTERYFADFA